MMNEVTRILTAIEQGDPRAPEELLPLVYDELRRLAALKLAREKPGQTLPPTALVHEAYLRLVDAENVPRWDSRGHFFAAAAEAMRRILVDQARRKRSERHGGRFRRCELLDGDLATEPANVDLLDLDEALVKLSRVDNQAAELVKLRVFAGMTVDEVAQYQGISSRTAKRSWAYARAWLMRELATAPDPGRG
jgi:RNA polymerase sigma factor (TIGR02999 family)